MSEKVPIKILHIEDNDDDAELISARVGQLALDSQIERVDSRAGFVHALDSKSWDLILADYNLPGFGASEALALLRESGFDVPFIVVSGTIGEERAIDMMRAGAQDFILKGDYGRLLPAIERELNEARSRAARRRAENALTVSEFGFKQLADAMPQLVWTTSGGRVQYVNAKWREYFGHELPAPSWWTESVHPADAPAALAAYEKGYRDLTPFEIEFRLRRKDGVFRWFLSRGVPIERVKEGPQRWFGTCTDIEASKQQVRREMFLSRAGSLLSGSLDYKKTLATVASLVVEEIADWCTVAMVGEDAVARTLAVAHRDPARADVARTLQKKHPGDWGAGSGAARVLRTGRSEIYSEISDELLVASASDENKLRMMRALALRSAMIVPLKFGEKTVGTISFFSSEPGRHYTGVDLAFAEDLASKASVAIENAEFFQRAESANRAKTDFLANMSHEIRTPLGAILGFADLMSDENQTVKDRLESLEVIRRNGQQLTKLVDEILDLTKIESAKLIAEVSEFSVRELVTGVVALLTLQAEAKRLPLETSFSDDVPEKIVSDPARLRQILINVIGNAIKFTSAGAMSVKVRKSPVTATREKIEIFVSDTGVGIAPEQSRRLFQPFVQADSSMTRKFGGTGLGLALSRKLAHVLGGDLYLSRSAPGEGSVFVISVAAAMDSPNSLANSSPNEAPTSLPPAATDTAKTPDPSAKAGGSTGAGAALRVLEGYRILVVDDAPDNRVLVSRYLVRAGAQVESASDGALGAEKALAGKYDVVLMDLQMPNVDGFEALKILREKEYSKPVVALTAHAMRGDRERCLDAGFSEHLSKPIDSRRLLELIQGYPRG